MKKILYIDAVGGIAGDMLVGGLLDLGVPFSIMEEGLGLLKIPHLEFSFSKEQRHHIAGVRFFVKNSAAGEDQQTRSFENIEQLLQTSELSAAVKKRALKIFEKLAIAEGKIHQVAPEKVHFHEVGAWDSIADIVGVALCLDYLQINDIFVSPVPTGTGFVGTEHGQMPIPAPATLLLLEGFEIIHDSVPFERTTPTGAAVLAALAQPHATPFQYTVDRVGVGIGTQKRLEIPNITRCILGYQNDEQVSQTVDIGLVECSETNVDDCTPECLGFVHERLLDAGALDVWFTPIQMKKYRPATLIQVLHTPENRTKIHRIIFQETTTLGIRYQQWNRVSLQRDIVELETPWGIVRGKKSIFDQQIHFSPEFDDCRKIALEHHIPLRDVFRVVEENFWEKTPSECF